MLVSADGPRPVFASWDPFTHTVTLVSRADVLTLDADCRGMFAGLCSLRELNADKLDASLVRDMRRMFAGCSDDAFNPDVSRWDVSGVRRMRHVFSDCSGAAFNPDLSRWNLSSVEDELGLPGPRPYLSNELVRGVRFNEILSRLAGGTHNVCSVVVAKGAPTPDGSVLVSSSEGSFPVYASWDPATGTVTLTSEADLLLVNKDADCMFRSFGNMMHLDADKLDTSLVKYMSCMFQNCSDDAFNPDVSGWDVSNVTNMECMFSGCFGVTFNPDLSGWDVSSVRDMRDMFRGCAGEAFNPDPGIVTRGSYPCKREDMFFGCRGASFNPDLSGYGNWKTHEMLGLR